MEHSFDIDIAKEYGIPAAILLKHIYYWVEKNRTNEKHYRDGCFWTYNSMKSFCQLFPYMSDSTIKRAIKKLVDGGLIIEAVYNDIPFDRTKWYTLTPDGYERIKNSVALVQNDQSHLVKMTKSDEVKMTQPIPYKYSSRTQLNNNISNTTVLDCPSDSEERNGRTAIADVIASWNELSEYGISPVIRITGGSKRYNCLKARLREYGKDAVLKAIENIKTSDFLQGKVKNDWTITFDWFVLPSNFPKVLEGNYNRRKPMSEPKEEMPTGLEKPKGGRQ